jgi:hypothetical protein
LDINNPDVFIHVWWDDSYLSDIGESYGIYSDTIDKIEELYEPTRMVVQAPIESFPNSNDELRKSRLYTKEAAPISVKYYYNLNSQWYSLKRSFDLKRDYERENGFLYDVAIRGRFDLDINKFPDLHRYKIRGRTSYMPTTMKYTLPEHPSYWNPNKQDIYRKYSSYKVFDSFGFGDSETMDVYSNLYDQVDLVLEKYPDFPFIAEFLLRRWLEDNGITINSMVDTNILLIREHGIRDG